MSDEEVEVVSPSPPQSPAGDQSHPSGGITADRANLRPVNVLLQRLLDVNPNIGASTGVMDQEENEDTVSGEDNSDVEIVTLHGEEVEVVMETTEAGDTQQARPPSRPSTPLPPADPPTMDPPAVDITSSPEVSGQEVEDTSPTVAGDTREVPVSPSVRTVAVPNPSPARVIANTRNSQTDFRSPKRRKLSSPAKPAPIDDDDDADNCPICFEPWTNSGSHRLASLRCGHLFGQSCIEKWLRGQGGKCPHCNAKAKRLDIRVIYAKSLKTLDTTERDRALKEAEHEKSLRMKAELATAQARLHYQLAVEECNRLKGELDKCQRQLSDYRKNPQLSAGPSSQSSQSNSRGQFKTGRVLKILETGGCRVLSFSPAHGTLVISQPSQSQLFPGFGIKKLNVMDFKTTQFVTMHSKAIRDLSFHPESTDGFLLSASMDKTVRLTNLASNAVIQTYETPMPVWSCVWNADDRNYFYAGQQNGTVLEFDIRNTQEHVQQMNTEGTRAPVVALQYVPLDLQATFRQGGLLVGQLDRVTFYERKTGEYKLHLLPADGNLTSLHFEPRTRHLLTSFRPTAKHPTVRHVMSEMTCTDISTDPSEPETLCSSNAVQTFHGGRSQKALSKTCLVPCPSDPSTVLVCGGDEATSTVHVWDSGDGRLVQKLAGGGPVVDMCPVEVNSLHYLATLTEKSLSIHQWV